MVLNKPVVGIAATSDGGGYYEVASDGGVFSYGDATFYGSTGSIHLNQPIVGMAVTPTGHGYWLVASDGGIFSYGDATFYGSTGSIRLNKPVVGMAATPSGHGYWLVASDGGIFSYGDASFYGSTGSIVLNKPIVGMITGPGGAGYFLVASDGGIFSFGTAPFYGSLGGQALKHPIVGGGGDADGQRLLVHRHRRPGLELRIGQLLRVRARRTCSGRSSAWRRPPGPRAPSSAGRTPRGPTATTSASSSAAACRGATTRSASCRSTGAHRRNENTCLSAELAWAGGGLNLYTYLTYGTSATNEPGCNGDTSCNAGYQAGIHAYTDAFNAGAGSPATPWWLDVENNSPSIGAWSSNTQENAQYVQGALNALHETEGVADVGIYASPGVWNGIVGDYTPSVPYWMADYLASPSGPGTCADYSNWVAKGKQLPGPPQIVQYNSGPVPGSSGNYDDDYAC